MSPLRISAICFIIELTVLISCGDSAGCLSVFELTLCIQYHIVRHFVCGRWLYNLPLCHRLQSSASTTLCQAIRCHWPMVKTWSWFPWHWYAVRCRSWHEASQYISSTLRQVALQSVNRLNALSLYSRLKMLTGSLVITISLSFIFVLSICYSNCNNLLKAKVLPATRAHMFVLIFDFVALSQTPVEAASPQTRGKWTSSTGWRPEGHPASKTLHPLWNVLFLHSFSFTAVSSPVWQGHGGMVFKTMCGEGVHWYQFIGLLLGDRGTGCEKLA